MAGSNPAARSAAGQSSRRSAAATLRSAMACAPSAARVRVLNSMTGGWSTSYTTVPAGHGRRYARESNPEARMTTCVIPAFTASRKYSS